MKLAIHFGVSTYTSSNEDWASAVAYALEAERLGVDSAWTAETWGYDGATPLAYLAAKTSRIRLGTGILQVGARTSRSDSHDRDGSGLALGRPLSPRVGCQRAAGDRGMAWHTVRSAASAFAGDR